MLYFLSAINIFLLIIFLVTLYNFFSAPLLKNGPAFKNNLKVSVLIPVRNEERNIKKCLLSVLEQDFPNFEIIVLDDFSTDNTVKFVHEIMEKTDKIKLLKGQPLPPGWTGKNWACFQLSLQATGEILIFTDADNVHSHSAVSHTVGWIQHLNLGLLSTFPQQMTQKLGEKLVVHVFDMFVYSFLPLWLTYYSKFPSLAAANGQWLAMTREAYDKIGGHNSVKNEIVEDTVLARLVKQKNIKILTTAGREDVYGKMYNSWPQVYNGFSKNAFGLMGYHTVSFIFFILLLFSIYVLPYILIFITQHILIFTALCINLLIRVLLSVKYKQPFWESVLLHPVGILLTLIIGVNSVIRFYKGSIEWKGRDVIFR
ncbi:glycosyltransferase [candidate division KSB1 bacterium]|nr:glycosyltransferase [candidate division KSB1 bacterium]